MVTNRYDYQQEARAGLELLAKRLEKLMEDSTKIGHITGATTFQSDADSVKARLARTGLIPEPEEARTGDRLMLRTGLRLLAHNLKAASGTVSALGKTDLADAFRDEAEYIEQKVLPRLEEQVPLRLEAANG